MDPLQSVNSVRQVTEVQRRERLQNREQTAPPPPREEAYYDPQISDTSKLFNALESQGFVSSEEMTGFTEELARSVRSGEFDASQMARSAPDPIQELAADQNIDLEQAMNELASQYTQVAYSAEDAGFGQTNAYALSEEEPAQQAAGTAEPAAENEADNAAETEAAAEARAAEAQIMSTAAEIERETQQTAAENEQRLAESAAVMAASSRNEEVPEERNETAAQETPVYTPAENQSAERNTAAQPGAVERELAAAESERRTEETQDTGTEDTAAEDEMAAQGEQETA